MDLYYRFVNRILPLNLQVFFGKKTHKKNWLNIILSQVSLISELMISENRVEFEKNHNKYRDVVCFI